MLLVIRIVLAIVGVLYCYLGIWCTVDPVKTSDSVGFALKPGSGQSEFITVYGGLEVGMGIVFLLPLLFPDQTVSALRACVIIHACLVLFRGLGFLWYTGIAPFTYSLAKGEWVIFLVTLGLLIAAWRSGLK